MVRNFGARFALVASALVSACAVHPRHDDTPVEGPQALGEFTTRNLYSDNAQPGCKSMLDSYCSYLYSPEVSGNLKVKKGHEQLLVLQGQTKNDFSAAYFEYARAKIRHRDRLPKDFLDTLDRHSYFDRLQAFLRRKPREQMSLGDRLQTMKEETELDSFWDTAITETVLKRMDLRHKDFHRIKEAFVPIELQVERRRVRRQLISEISKSIWRNHPNWVKVEKTFHSLQDHFIDVIRRLDIPPEMQSEWTARIRSVELVIPGAMPETSDDECSTTQNNAYYYPYLNVITVCAGDFNSEDIIETMAHELGHALDIQRSVYLYQQESALGRSIAALRAQVCKPEKFSCGEWEDFKLSFHDRLLGLRTFEPQLTEFQQCLQRRPSTRPLLPSDVDQLSETLAGDQVSSLADSEIYLRITKPKLPLPNGKLHPNLNYLDPCSYYTWTKNEEPIDDDLTNLIFFTAEYRCSAGAPVDKMKHSIELAKSLMRDLFREAIDMEGEFSARKILESQGYSSSPSERFADVIGSYALASALAEAPAQPDRRNTFLASSSWQCTKPSLANSFPEETTVQSNFVFDAHPDGEQRKMELFSRPVRDILGCRKDFNFDACEIPFKQSVRLPASENISPNLP